MSKNYLIVGGRSGIGASISEALIAAGHQVYIASREAGADTAPAGAAAYLQWDAMGEEALSGLPEQLDGLAYCPGTIRLKPFHRIKDAEYLQDFQINTLGAIKALRAALPALKKSEQAAVVFFSTVAVGQGMPFHASVAAAKGGIEGITRALAAELGAGIRVNCVAPSIVDTPLAGNLLSTDEKRDNAAKRHPLKRVGKPEDIANAALYLLSEDSSWMTGQVLGIDGGMSTIRPL